MDLKKSAGWMSVRVCVCDYTHKHTLRHVEILQVYI